MIVHVLSLIGDSLREAFFMFWETLWALVLGFGLSGAVQAFVSRAEMQRALGGQGIRSLARATAFGMISSSCSYAASAMAKSLFQKGANFTAAMVFMFASTNLVIELGLVLWVLMGWQFTASEFVGGFIMIALFALLSRFVFTPMVVEAARKRLQAGGTTHEHDHAAHGASHEHDHGGHTASEEGESVLQRRSWRERLTSPAGWADAASYAMADLTMLRKEMLVGYLVAGILAVFVPASIWNDVFISGHGFWTSLENVIVGPFIAVISFVCSIGNVPLAAALWQGGISFGGAVSFIFADLITLPLILIYRKYYGGRLTLRLVALSWLVMAAAGLIVEYLFQALGLVPAHHAMEIMAASLQWNYTTILNIIFLALFGVLFWLSRNQARFGGGAGYAIDPVCGMQVQTAHAPATTRHAGHTYYFCSDHCRERFARDPDRYTRPGAEPEGMTPETGTAIDPICGMTVDPAHAAAQRDRDGVTYYFCSPGCAEAFDQNPDRSPAATAPACPRGSAGAMMHGHAHGSAEAAPAHAHDPSEAAPAGATDPVCGMTVAPESAAATRTYRSTTYYFCAPGCAETFDAAPERYSAAMAGTAPGHVHGA